jgi:hypothetical protein
MGLASSAASPVSAYSPHPCNRGPTSGPAPFERALNDIVYASKHPHIADIAHRLERQSDRIRNELDAGKINGPQAMRLYERDRVIAMTAEHMVGNGSTLSNADFKTLTNELNRTTVEINQASGNREQSPVRN